MENALRIDDLPCTYGKVVIAPHVNLPEGTVIQYIVGLKGCNCNILQQAQQRLRGRVWMDPMEGCWLNCWDDKSWIVLKSGWPMSSSCSLYHYCRSMSIKISGWSMSRILYVNWMEFWMQDRHRYFLRDDMWWLLHTYWSTNATQNYKKCTITSPTVALETNQNIKIWIKNLQEPALDKFEAQASLMNLSWALQWLRFS